MRKAGLGRAESEVLRYVADHHPITVREAAEHFARTKGQAKTTILNVMERLREKGFLVREQAEGVYQYSPTQPKGGLLRDLVRDFVDGMLGGSVEPFAAYLAEKPRISAEELARLKQTVAELEAAGAEDATESDEATPGAETPDTETERGGDR
jgi:predicted transcriptional regulator